ncbi:MAG: flagellar motor protein MotB [Cytophagales bacterium]
MKNFIWITIPLSAIIYFMSTSCVPTRKLKQAQIKIDTLKSDSSRTHTSLDACNTQVKNLMTDKRGLQNEKAGLIDDKTGLQNENLNIQNNLNNLSTTSNMTIADQAKRLKSLQDLIQAQRDALNKLKQTMTDALINFKADELSVTIKDGNVYVSMQEKLLFKSGSSEVDPKGKQALAKLAVVLNTTSKDINVMIEGHTDNVPMKTAKFEDNWALSSGRALSIVRILTKDYGVDAFRVVATGSGEYHPVKTNDTEAGKASNRRTEIILSPNLSELYKLINQ